LAAAALPWPAAGTVGGWWNRAFDPEIDLIGAERDTLSMSAACCVLSSTSLKRLLLRPTVGVQCWCHAEQQPVRMMGLIFIFPATMFPRPRGINLG
jgi:hypothetical protein